MAPTRRRRPCEEHFHGLEREIALETPSLQLIDETPSQATINGFAARGLKAVYQAPAIYGFEDPVDSTLYLFSIGTWYLKFRFTYPRQFAAELGPLERQLIASVRWAVPSATESDEHLCQELADSYELIAKSRDAGLSRARILEIAGKKEDVATQNLSDRVFINSVDVAYANPDKKPAEIRQLVLGDCELGKDGKPVLRTLWPWTR